ncbi:MAG: hypothetical protein LBG30_04215 [Odoribacteraceae bacterium]|jgi:hypothetical protein|nr:hypothetical protein [Odoribacteraceae bacterium]
MARGEDWVKSNHREFFEQVASCRRFLFEPENLGRMGFKEGSDALKWLQGSYVPVEEYYNERFLVWDNPDTKTSIATGTLVDAEKKMKKVFRRLYMGYLRNNGEVSSGDLRNMSMPERFSGPRKRPPVWRTAPYFFAVALGEMVLQLRFGKREGFSVKIGKPEGQAFAEVRWGIGDAPILKIEELKNVEIMTRSPLTLTFNQVDRGKIVSFTMCWHNTRAQRGPFGEIKWMPVP